MMASNSNCRCQVWVTKRHCAYRCGGRGGRWTTTTAMAIAVGDHNDEGTGIREPERGTVAPRCVETSSPRPKRKARSENEDVRARRGGGRSRRQTQTQTQRRNERTNHPQPGPAPNGPTPTYTCKKSVRSESASPRCLRVVHAIGDWLIRPRDAPDSADSAVAGVPALSLSRSRSRSSMLVPRISATLKLPSRAVDGVVVRIIGAELSCGLEPADGGYPPFRLDAFGSWFAL